MTILDPTAPLEAHIADMANATFTVEGLNENELELVLRLSRQIAHKWIRNNLRDSYYDGKRAIRQVGRVIPPHYYRLGLVLGWSAKAVDVLARRCNLDDIIWPGAPDDGSTSLDTLGLPELAEQNNLTGEISGALVSSLIHGPAFLVTTKGVDNEPAALLHVVDALHATGDWNGRTRRLDNLLSVTQWAPTTRGGQPSDFTLYLPNQTITVVSDDRGQRKVENRSTHSYGLPVEALVYKPRPSRPLGSSRISRAVMSLHDAALRTVIRMEGHADVYSFPEMWLLGADQSIFQNEDGTPKAAWQIMLGRIKAIPDDPDAQDPKLARADVQQFQAHSPEPHLLQLKQQAQLFSGETSIPLTSLGVSDMSNPTSADSYIASREDLIAEAEGATDDWTPPLRRAIQRLLMIANQETKLPDEWRTIAPKWRNPLYLSRAAQADAGAKSIGAVPWLAESEVGLELLGLDPQQIQRALTDRRRINGRQIVAALNPPPAPPAPIIADDEPE